MEEWDHQSINMKEKLRKGIIRDVCFVCMLVIGAQICLFLLFTKSTPTNQGHEIILATNRGCNKSFPNPLALNQSQLQDETIICDRSHNNYDWCFLKCPTILNPNTTTFYTIGSIVQNRISISHPLIEKIRPYPRKWENFSMSRIREITLTTSSINNRCQIYHKGPALVFSIGGYTGNFFHDFNDGIIPLYITLNTLFPNQDNVALVIVDFKDWWYSKYEILLRAFPISRVINLDNQTTTHCFSSVAVGLISHGPMTIHPNQNQQMSFLKLRSLLEITYGSHCKHVTPRAPLKPGKPRVVFMGRTGNVGRVILNQNEIINAMERAGFEVILFEPTKFTWLCDAYKLVNESHGMIGVHGAALTHSIFLRPGSILIQIVPIGIEWLADSYFKNLAKSLKFEYIEYKIRAKESSLAEKYGLCHMIVKNPHVFMKGNWSIVDSIYLKGQDVRLCLDRFRKYLVLAYSKAKRFMDING